MSDKRTTDKELGALLDYFAERLTRIYAHHFCLFEFDENEDELDSSGMYDRDSPVKIIQNACLHASLIAIRDLDDFLSPRDSKSKSDDLKASNFGFTQSRAFLTASEREAINKQIAHTTTFGARSQGYPWDIWELISKCEIQSLAFLRWVENHFGPSHFLLYTGAIGSKNMIQYMHARIAAEIEKRKK